MARDTRRSASKARLAPRYRSRSCVWWFLLGAMVGSFGVGLYWMMEAPQQPPPVAALPKVERPAPPRPSYQFEDILKDAEVEIGGGEPPPPPAPRPEPIPPEELQPATPEAPETAAAVPPQPVKPASPGSYLLQVGSFKRAADAERLKAELALLGISTSVESVTINDGQIYHRVRTGPLDGKQAMEQMKATLKRHGKDPMAVKVK
jgi:cell division protein FtsN